MRNRDPVRDLPDPPRRSQDNYCAALAELYRALDEAEMVAPEDRQRGWVQETRDVIRAHLMDELDALGEDPAPPGEGGDVGAE